MKRMLVAGILILSFATLVNAQAPAFRWAMGAGSTGQDYGQSIAVDVWGNCYETATYSSPTITIGSSTFTNAGGSDIVLMKFDVHGNILWARSFGGSLNDIVCYVGVDAAGNCYLEGYFLSPTITFGPGTLINVSPGTADIFLVKFDAAGTPVWAGRYGGTGTDQPRGFAVDAAGTSYMGGNFSSATLTIGSTILTNAGADDMFITKIDANGNVLWAKSAGGTGSDQGLEVAADLSGNAIVTGIFSSASITFGSTTLTNALAGSADVFTVKYDAGGNVIWARAAGGTGWDNPGGIAVDPSGNILVAGWFTSSPLTIGSTTLTNSGSTDMFIVKYSGTGNVVWAKSSDGLNDESGFCVAADASGNSYVIGDFSDPTLTFGSTTLINAGGTDMFIVKYDAGGNVGWATNAIGTGSSFGRGITVDASSNAYVTGYFQNASMTIGNITLGNAGASDIFIAKLDGNPPSLVDVKDVPADQGGKVLLQWNAAAIDKFVENTTAYSIWRALPAGQMPPASAAADQPSSEKVYRQFPLNGVNYYWEWIADQPPELLPQYAYAAPTLSDSISPANIGMEYFFVSARTSDPNVFYASNVDSGYSVDNIPPVPPAGLAAVVEGGSEVYLSWNSPSDPDVGHYDIYRSTTSGFTPTPALKIGTSSSIGYDDGSPLTGSQAYYRIIAVDVHGNVSAPSTQVSAGITTTTSLSVNDRWNMVSVPLAVSDFSKVALYPAAISNAFAYNGSSYIITSTLATGTGFWLKFNGAQSVSMTGFLLTSDTINVTAGWNMIGSLSSSIPVANVGSIPGGLITSNFFGYNGSYHIATNIEPGQGYWVKVNQSGKLVLSSSGNTPAAAKVRIELQDGMPPAPPTGNEAYGNRGLPTVYQLGQNYPNPFNPSTVIKYSLPSDSHVKLSIYNTLGQEVMRVVDEDQDAGYKSVPVNMSNLPSGLYTYRITAGTFTDVKKMVLVK